MSRIRRAELRRRPPASILAAFALLLYAACGLSNEVSVIDTATNKVVGQIKAGAGPWGVAIR